MRNKLIISALLSGLFLLTAVCGIAGQNSNTWLGVYTQTIDKDLQEAFGLDSDRGALIKQVVPDSPAEKAGLKPGDIIIKLGDKELINSDDLSAAVMAMNPDDEVDIQIIRKGEEETLSATLGSGDKEDYQSGPIFKWYGGGAPGSKYNAFNYDDYDFKNSYIGINLESLNDQLSEFFGVGDNVGILITEVLENSPAEEAGLKAGDVITEIDGEKITDISDIQKAVRQKEKGEEVEITFLRNKKKRELSVEVAEAPESLNKPFGRQFPDPSIFHSFVPNMKGMFFGNPDDNGYSGDKHKEIMEKMQNDIDQLKKELEDIKNKIN